MESSSHKRAREVVDLAAAGEAAAVLEADAKRLRPQDLLDLLDDDSDAAAAGDLASVMRSLEEEIASFDEAVAASAAAAAPSEHQPELGFLLEASDDELGLPPAGASASSSEDAGGLAPESAGALDDGQIWGFEDEIDGGGFGGYSPEAAAAAAVAAAAWDDDGFDAGLFAFGDDPADLGALRHETMPAV